MPTPVVLPPIASQSGSASLRAKPSLYFDTLSYDASSKTYTAKSTLTSPGPAPVTFGAADIVSDDGSVTTYQHVDAANSSYVDQLVLSRPGSDNGKIHLSHSGYGSYAIGRPGYFTPDYFVFGQTPTALPLTGVATYAGIVDGCSIFCTNRIGGTSNLSLDFQTATFTTKLALTFTPATGYAALGPLTLTGVGALDANNPASNGMDLSGILVNSDGSVNGSLNGRLYGPNGNEFGLKFSTTGYNNAYNLNGVAVGTQQGVASEPADQTLAGSLQRGDGFYALNVVESLTSPTSGNVSSYSGQNLLRYDAATDSYILGRDSFSNQGHFQVLTFGATQRQSETSNFTSYIVADPSDPTNTSKNLTVSLFKVGPANSALNLTYASYGYYVFNGVDGTHATSNYDAFLYGVATPLSAIPTTGSATYAGLVDGLYTDPNGTYRIAGSSALTANFAAQSLGTSLTFTGANTAAGGPALSTQTFNGTGNFATTYQNVAQFRGSMSSATVAGLSGGFAGNFYGPHAEEFGYTFTLGNGTTSANSTVFASGVALGKR